MKNAIDHEKVEGLEKTKMRLRNIVVERRVEPHEEPLSPVACVTKDSLIDSYIISIVGFKKELDVKSLKASLVTNLGQHQRFSSVVIRDKKKKNLKWCLREIVIEDHVVEPILSSSFIQNPNFVNDYAASLASAPPLNPCRPMWEVHVLNHKSEDAAATLVFRIHHSLGDCVSMLSLIINSTSTTISHPLPASSQTHANFTKPHPCKYSCSQSWTGLVQTIFNLVLCCWLTMASLVNYTATLLGKRDRSPLRRKKMAVSSKRLAHVTLNMDDICLVKKAVNGTLNDVLMGVLSAGLLRYMNRRNAKKTTNEHLPSNLSVRALVAVNMRKSPVLEDLDVKMKHPSEAMWGNKLGFWLFPLPVKAYTDPLDFCRATTTTSRSKKLSFEASMAYHVERHGSTKLVAFITRLLALRTTLGVSNVMGPQQEVQYDDNPITHIIPTAQLNYTSIVIHFISYANKGKLIALVSEDVIPDPEQLCTDCRDALQLMKQSAHAKNDTDIRPRPTP